MLYDSNIVPVGRDQKQHVEVTRDIAIKFNDSLRRDVRHSRSRKSARRSRWCPALDGQKMSKSYGNTIEIFGDEKATRKKIMSIVMDSRTPAGAQARRGEKPRDPVAQARRARRRRRRISRTDCAPAASATAI